MTYEQAEPAYTNYAPNTPNYEAYAPTTNTYQSTGYTNVYSRATGDEDTTAVEGLVSADSYLETLAAEAEQAERDAFMTKYERATPETETATVTIDPVDITV